MAELGAETADVLARLIRFRTVNPPGGERPQQEWLAGYLGDAGFECELIAAEDESRPNLVARLPGGDEGRVLAYLSHADTVLADAAEWEHDPWSGDVHDGFLWGRGAIDMKSQTAAECVAAAHLARSGWRPARGELKLFCVVDEETGGRLGAQWLTEERPDLARADWLLNEGGGAVMPFGDRRLYGVGCAEKGTVRFRLRAHGRAGHASVPTLADNALLRLLPAVERIGAAGVVYEVTDEARAFLEALGEDAGDPARAVERLRTGDPDLAALVEPTLGATFAPTIISASEKINVIPSRAEVSVDCRLPPGLGSDVAKRRVDELLDGHDGVKAEFFEEMVGNRSTHEGPLMDAIREWIAEEDPAGEAVPWVMPAFTDSRWWRAAFPDCVAYGFFPQSHQTLYDAWPLMHSADERIDVRDLDVAVRFFADLPRRLLG